MAVPMGKRDIEWVTVTDYTTVTIDETTTLYVEPTAGPGPEQPAIDTTTNTPAATPTSKSPAQFFVPPTMPTTTPTYTPPATPAAVTPTTTPITTPPPANTYVSTAAAAPTSAAAPAGNVGGPCPPGSPCSGDMTHYDAGLGACGETDNGDQVNVVALPFQMMGEQSNGNPFCGRTISISYKGKTTTAVVKDKCMGCYGNAIDLSNHAFQELADLGIGRDTCTWNFVD